MRSIWPIVLLNDIDLAKGTCPPYDLECCIIYTHHLLLNIVLRCILTSVYIIIYSQSKTGLKRNLETLHYRKCNALFEETQHHAACPRA